MPKNLSWLLAGLMVLAMLLAPQMVSGNAPSLVPVTVAHADDVLRGDANGNTVVDMGDPIYVEWCIMGVYTCSPGADADADSDVDMGDLLTMLNIIMAQP